jgi:hypothetical protein
MPYSVNVARNGSYVALDVVGKATGGGKNDLALLSMPLG